MNRRFLTALAGGFMILGLAGGVGAAPIFGVGAFPFDRGGAAGLDEFTGCAELKGYLVSTAQWNAWRQAVYSTLTGGNIVISPPVPGAPGMAPTEDAGAPPDYSQTNVQESGVDEPDLVKTDGDYIYLLNGGYLLVADAWPAATMKELARLQIEGDPVGMFLYGDIALVISNVWEQAALEDGLSFMPAPFSSLTKATLVDLTNRAAPATVRELYLEGAYSAARLIDGRAHLAVVNNMQVYVYEAAPMMPMAPAESKSAAPAGLFAAFQGVRQFSSALARKNIADLVPQMEDRRMTAAGVEVETGPISDCDQFYRPDAPNGPNTVSVVTLDLNAPQAEPNSVTVVTDNGEVYASADNLYIAASRYDGVMAASETTTVHKFALGAAPAYVASGNVGGWIVNRYAMGEHEGYFRIATTTDMWGQDGEGPRNQLYVMGQNGDQLEVVGRLGGLGHEGERIYAVRYDGDRGYLVTFRQTDPLYVLDLSDPTAPKTAGEVEIPGFSTYLHPIADGFLLAIGQNTELGGADLSLFDVRNPAAPALTDREWLGEGSWSEAMYEPHAFTYFAPLKQIALPLQQWSYPVVSLAGAEIVAPEPVGFNGTVVFDVDTQTGLTKRGAVDHGDASDPWAWTSNVLRNLYIGSPGDYVLYSLSQAVLKASNALTLKDLASIELPGKNGGYGPIYTVTEPASMQ